jgi:hypothetical protein
VQARGDAQDLLAVIEPEIALGHALLLETALGSKGLLRILEQYCEVSDGGVMEGTQGPLGRLLHQPSPPG